VRGETFWYSMFSWFFGLLFCCKALSALQALLHITKSYKQSPKTPRNIELFSLVFIFVLTKSDLAPVRLLLGARGTPTPSQTTRGMPAWWGPRPRQTWYRHHPTLPWRPHPGSGHRRPRRDAPLRQRRTAWRFWPRTCCRGLSSFRPGCRTPRWQRLQPPPGSPRNLFWDSRSPRRHRSPALPLASGAPAAKRSKTAKARATREARTAKAADLPTACAQPTAAQSRSGLLLVRQPRTHRRRLR